MTRIIGAAREKDKKDASGYCAGPMPRDYLVTFHLILPLPEEMPLLSSR